jgi:choline dehydrogenase-like flavoprotein
MGRDDLSVVDGNLRVYGIDGLGVADGSIMPNVTTGNTMAPCVIIGERAAEIHPKRTVPCDRRPAGRHRRLGLFLACVIWCGWRTS